MEIPLFPLHTALCPGIVVPLHIFEERYRALTRHCLETGEPFGIVLIRDGREVGASGRVLALAEVGALVEIREAGRYADGRYDLLAAATGRFAIESVDLDLARAPYIVADVTPLADEVGDEVRAERLAALAIRRFVRYLELMRIREGESGEALDIRVELDSGPGADEPDDASAGPDTDVEAEDVAETSGTAATSLTIPDDPTVLSYLLSGIVQVELPRRQRLLEAATTVERLEELIALLDREVLLLSRRLRLFSPETRIVEIRRS